MRFQIFSFYFQIGRAHEAGFVIDYPNLVAGFVDPIRFASQVYFHQFIANQDWDTFVPILFTVMENSAAIFDLQIAPLR